MAHPRSIGSPLPLLAIYALAVMQAALHVQSLPLRHEVNTAIASAATAPTDNDGFLPAMRDEPPGAYFELLSPLVAAVDITYRSSSGPFFQEAMVNATIAPELDSGEVWVRAPQLEADPQDGGVHMRVFVSHEGKRVICSFRGACTDKRYRQCLVDTCTLHSIRSFGDLTNVVYPTLANCSALSGELNYFEQAEDHVKRVQAKFPNYSVVLTGHSLGGAMSIAVAATQPGVLKAVAFGPSPFHSILLDQAGFSEADILHLPAQDLIVIGDPYDIFINSLFVDNARVGATTCILYDLNDPFFCTPRMWEDKIFDEVLLLPSLACKFTTHDWKSSYMKVLLETQGGSEAPLHLPTCSPAFSVSQAELKAYLQSSGKSQPKLT